MQKRDRIVILLDFYNDVRDGFSDPPNGGGDGVSRFSTTWSGPAYTQLRALLLELGLTSPSAYIHLTGYYLHPTWVRRSRCPRCHSTFPPSSLAKVQNCDGYTHGRRFGNSVTLEPFMQRTPPKGTKQNVVNLALDWLTEQWQGEAELPKEVRECLHHRQVIALQRGRPLALA